MTRSLVIGLASLMASSVQGQDDAPFADAAGRLSIQFPAPPRREVVPVLREDTDDLQVVVFSARHDGRTWVASYSDLARPAADPTHAEAVLDHSRDGVAAHARGTVADEKRIAIEKSPGRSFTLNMAGGSAAKVRLFLVGNRLYHLMVIGTPTGLGDPSVPAFLDSLKLTR